MHWLNDRYRLDARVGRGGMAVVWRGYDAVLKRVVAVKMLPGRGVDDTSRERLRNEAHAAARLNHPAIANVYDFGEAHVGRRRRAPFLVMEYVDGPTLSARLSAGTLPWYEATSVCADVAAALAFAHAHGLVHRDIKPANVMLSPAGVKVVDFGIAGASGQHQVDGDGVVFGTRAYMAPEQVAGTTVAPASDVYALGLLLYECLTGLRHGHGTGSRPTVPDRPDGVATAPLPPGVPTSVTELLQACLATDPARRPTSSEVAEVLRRVMGAIAGPVATIRAGALWTDTPTVAQDGPVRRGGAGRSLRRRKVSLPQAALATMSAAALAVALALQLPDAASSDALPSVIPAPEHPNRASATDCVTRFSAQYRTDGTFTAVLDLKYTGVESLSTWSVRFALGDGQLVVGADGSDWVQDHGIVTITTGQPLQPGQTVSVALHGTAANQGNPPGSFALDGHTCSRSATDVETTRSVSVPGPTLTVEQPVGRQDGPARQPTKRPPRGSSSSVPAPTDPTPSDPTPSDPTPSDPTPSDPPSWDPTPADPAPAEPTTIDPTTTAPPSSQPVPTAPSTSGPEG